MDEIIELTKVDFASLFISIFVILIGFKAIISLFEWIVEKLGLETKAMRIKREDHELLLTTANSLKNLSQEHKQDIQKIYDDNINYRDQSRVIKDDFKESINNLSRKLDLMQERTDMRFKENEEKENKRVQAEIKDKIAQSYRYYNSVGEITDMELESLEDLISTYENYGGSNSFVHSVVQKEMYTWKKAKKT